MTQQLYKYPRLYLNVKLQEGVQIFFGVEHVHYLKTVLRKNAGDYVRVFNGSEGEFLVRIESFSKKDGLAIVERCLGEQPKIKKRFVLYFAPIKKQRMDILIEKAVELGVSELHPVLTARTENRDLNIEKLRAQIVEAAEQCERMDIPVLHETKKLSAILHERRDLSLYAALERANAKPLAAFDMNGGAAFLIGPEGGFDPNEVDLIGKCADVQIVNLGDTILRAETAVFACLSYAKLSTESASEEKKR